MESKSDWERRRLEVIQGALIARVHELETRKRLPRGYSVGEVFRERNILENEISRLGSLRAQLIRGVEVGERVPAAVSLPMAPLANGSEPEPSYVDGTNV